jgi:hypothetical protein
MGILTLGKTECVLCHKPISDAADVVIFPPFVANEADPLYLFNDAAAHESCFATHPLRHHALGRMREAEGENAPEKRNCIICGMPITDPDEFFTVGHLTDNKAQPVHRWNYAKMHKSCLSQWKGLEEVLQYLEAFRLSGQCCGHGVDYLIKILQKAS